MLLVKVDKEHFLLYLVLTKKSIVILKSLRLKKQPASFTKIYFKVLNFYFSSFEKKATPTTPGPT